ncbi:ABC transporter permease subunit [Streptomyces sp. NBC_00568]|uniref:ABC transporter permease subunit n=1 Tax=Streptomyces sp. NBC_00568 TaxID=2975779 RepID=UPI00224E06FD|nr:ABC transporter permease subunit [Streptomyces sp. NBC_00568]MCX4993637.1 ABC transporter permease [Streptomyces sp. NBC_00568]
MSMMTNTSGPAPTVTEASLGRGFRLSGMNWLVWRQHRAAFWTLLTAATVTVGVIIYARHQMITYLDGHGWPHLKSGWEEGFDQNPLNSTANLLGFVPIVIGVFMGAPLLAGDLENGTAKLVAAQSTSRARWLATKLGMTSLLVVVCTTAVAAAFTWWLTPVKTSSYVLTWSDGPVFDSSGPVPVALTLLTMVGGVAIGMLLRRTLLSMVVTLGFAVAVQMVWSHFRMSLGDLITVTSRNGVVSDNSYPNLPDSAHVVDQSYLTASGDLIGWGSCAQGTDGAMNACLEKAQVVGWHIQYIPVSQMSSMQWLGASILLTLTVGITVFVILWGRKRLV